MEAEQQHTQDAAAAGRIWCALEGADRFRLDCTMDRIASSEGNLVIVGRANAGYRRLRLVPGRGVETADGAEQAIVQIIDDGLIEVTVGPDRYRLPATVRAGSGAAGS